MTLDTTGKLVSTDKSIRTLVGAVKDFPIMKPEDTRFLSEHAEHLAKVMDKSFMWRTDAQKRSILSDLEFPTTHAKFHQAMLEQKVQFEQTMYLAKDFESLKIDIQLLECDLDELMNDNTKSETRKDLEGEKIKLEIQFKTFELNKMHTQMNYRMSEIRGWQQIMEELYNQLLEEGYNEEEIWNKEEGELQFLFLLAMNKFNTATLANDVEGVKSILPLARFVYQQAEKEGKLDIFMKTLTPAQEKAVEFIKNNIKNS